MSRFIPTSKSTQCPICQDAKGKCRSKEDEGKIFVLCMTVGNATKGEVINGFKCVNPRGRDAWGSTWVEAKEDENYSPEASQKYRQQREKAERRHQAFLRGGLKRSERDLNFKRISEGLGLCQEHRRALQARGLTNEAINKGLFFSAIPDQFIPKGIDIRTPGISFGNKLAVGQSSLACPAFDPQGNIIGYQLRLDKATNNKYRWAKGKYPSHLCNGELPITVARPVEGKPAGIGMSEGILKPYIAAQIHQKIFIGASGANFASSPEQLKLYLAEVSQETGTKVIDFYPDAGTVSNPHVVRSYRKTFALLESLGCDVQVAWWGQAKKEDKDCDEIATDTPIQYLSLSEFEDICIQHGGYIPSVQKPEGELTDEELEEQRKEEFYRRVVAVQRPLRTLTYKSDIIFTPQDGRYLPSLVNKVPETGILLLTAPKGAGKSNAIKELKDYLCHGQIKTGDEVDGIPVVEFIDRITKRFTSSTPRIALGREQAIRWVYTWGGDVSTNDEKTIDGVQADKFKSIDDIGTTFDSFWKLSGRDFSNTVWVLDECELGLSHLALSSTLKGKRPLILRLFGEKIRDCLENGGLIILSDADLTDVSVDYIRSFCPNAPIFGVEYQGNPEPWHVCFHTGKKDDVLQQIIDWLDPDFNEDYLDPIHIFVDNKDEGVALEQILIKKFPELSARIGGIVRIDSSVTQTDFGRKFVERPNKSIEELKPRVLISTQSLGVGVSIDIPWFKAVFGLCFGTSEPSQARQGLARVRQNVPRIIWAADKGKMEHGLRGSFFPEEIKANLFSHNESTSEVIELAKDLTDQKIQNQCDAEYLPELIKTLQSMMGLNKKWDNKHLDLMVKFQARRNFSMSQFALQLRQELIDEGNDVTDFGCAEELGISEEIKEQKKENRWVESQLTSQSPIVDEDEARRINLDPSATDVERRSAAKTLMAKELPGITLTAEFIHRAYTEDKGRWKNSVKLFWSCHNLEATRERDLSNWRYKLKQFSEGAVYIPDINTLSLQCKALIESGIFQFIEQEKSAPGQYIDESPEMRGFLNWAEENKKLLQRAFGMKPGKSSIQFVNKLLSKVGIGMKVTKTEKLPNGNKLRWYRVDTSTLSDPDRIAILESLDRAWQIRQEEKIQKEQAWLEQQAQAAQDPIYPNLKSKDGGVTTEGVTTEGVTTKTDTDRLIDALKAVVNLEEFSQVVGGRQISMVENAIAGSGPDQPRRQQLSAWLAALQEPAAGESRTADPQEERRQLGLAKLLAEALEHGCDTVKAFLSRLDSTDRWVAAIKFEEIDEARSQQLLELHPDFYNWLSSGCIN